MFYLFTQEENHNYPAGEYNWILPLQIELKMNISFTIYAYHVDHNKLVMKTDPTLTRTNEVVNLGYKWSGIKQGHVWNG